MAGSALSQHRGFSVAGRSKSFLLVGQQKQIHFAAELIGEVR
jgi:hypothetical protein